MSHLTPARVGAPLGPCELEVVPAEGLDPEAAENRLAEYVARIVVERWKAREPRAKVGDPPAGCNPPTGLTKSA